MKEKIEIPESYYGSTRRYRKKLFFFKQATTGNLASLDVKIMFIWNVYICILYVLITVLNMYLLDFIDRSEFPFFTNSLHAAIWSYYINYKLLCKLFVMKTTYINKLITEKLKANNFRSKLSNAKVKFKTNRYGLEK